MENVKSRLKCINRDMLKMLVIPIMTAAHIIAYMNEYGIITDLTWWMSLITCASMIAPPVFLFSVAEGFRYTRSRKNYAVRLLLFALITQIPFCLANHGTLLTLQFFTLWNVIGTMFLGLVSLMIWESKRKLPVRIILLVLLDALSVLLSFEWMLFGIPIVLGFHIFRDKPKARLIWYTVITLLHALIANGFAIGKLFFVHVFSMMLAYFLMTACYNGKKGRHPVFAKWFFYIFYPAHLLLIYFIRLAA